MSICLNSRFPIAVYWGPEYLMLYNQSLVPMVGPKKHPQALGQPASVVLAEIWQIIEPLLRQVRTTGEATWSEDLDAAARANGRARGVVLHLHLQPDPRRDGRRRRRLLRGRRDHRQGDRGAPAAPAQRARRSAARADAGRGLRARGGGDRARAERRPLRASVSPRRVRRRHARGSGEHRRGEPPGTAHVRPGDAAPWPFEDRRTQGRAALRRAHGRSGGRARRGDPADRALGRRPALRLRGRRPQPDAVAERRPTSRFHTLLAASISQGGQQRRRLSRRSASAPRRWPSSIAPRPRSSAT